MKAERVDSVGSLVPPNARFSSFYVAHRPKRPSCGLTSRTGLDRGRPLVTNGFFVTGIQEGLFSNVRIVLSETKAYPRNAGVTVEYQLMSLEGAFWQIACELLGSGKRSRKHTAVVGSKCPDRAIGYGVQGILRGC